MSQKFLLATIAGSIGVFVVGYAVGNLSPFEERVAVHELVVNEKFLTNPIFYEWWASAEGMVVAKENNSLTIERDGKRVELVIRTEDALTQIFRDTDVARGETPALASYDDIVIGSTIRAGVAIARKGTTGMAGAEDVAIATTIVIIGG